MKILPDYLIQYMPAIEDAMEELRLSILDHAYDLLKRLDIDELTADEIRQKLELYDIKVDNMSSEWLPNGRFYRLYPYIKHHRSRLNTINAIAKSGGQFEGLWSKDFAKKSEYKFNTLSVNRHYTMKSSADGYFYITGDTSYDGYGRVTSSAVQALTTDIFINQSLPAGYTYLYIPWPRPVYPSDSSYFYNVHMLDYDRLYYVQDCLDDNALPVDISVPASTLHDWNHTGEKDSPYRTPIWFDYHYMNNVTHADPTDDFAGTWPIKESGIYLDSDGFETNNPSEAVLYVLDGKCKELSDSHAAFPTKCYGHERYETTMPDRWQEYTPYSADAGLYLESFSQSNRSLIIDVLVDKFALSVDEASSLLDTAPCKLPLISSYEIKSAKSELESLNCVVRNITIDSNCLTDIDYLYVNTPSVYRWDSLARDYFLNIRDSLHHIKTYKPFWNEKTPFIEMCYTNSSNDKNHSLYNWLHLKESNNIINAANYDALYYNGSYYTYSVTVRLAFPLRPAMIAELKNIIYEMTGEYPTSSYVTLISSVSRESAESVYNTILDKADESHVYIDISALKSNTKVLASEHQIKSEVIKENNSPISEITHTSYDRATLCKLDPVYTAYTYPSDSGSQGDNKTIADTITNNEVFYFGSSSADTSFDPRLSYTLVGVGVYNSESDDQTVYTDDLEMYLECQPNSGQLYINNKGNALDANYVLFKTSTVHKLYFSKTKDNTTLKSKFNMLYNEFGSEEIYYHNGVNNVGFSFNIIGIYDDNGNRIEYANHPEIACTQNTSGERTQYYISCSDVKVINRIIPDFNNQWIHATRSEDAQYTSQINADYTIYRSFSNVGVDSSSATMYIHLNFDEDTSFVLKYMNCSEGDIDDGMYDGLEVYLDNERILSIYDTIRHSDQPIWQDLNINVHRGEHILKLVYEKDTGTSEFNDCAYIAIPELNYNNSDYVKASYILFTADIFDGSVDDSPVVKVFIQNSSGEISSTNMIPTIGKIEVDGNYITLAEFDSLGYTFAANGTHQLNYSETASELVGGNLLSYHDPNYIFKDE